MRTIAVYNMKGGVGKTTTAVNLSYVAASSGQRVLLWDLDPQAASSFSFRIRPRVEHFGRRLLRNGRGLGAAVKETDYANLDLLPADFAYRKFERFLDDLGRPDRIVASLIDALGRDYDIVVLDCPAGFSLLIEGVLAAADTILMPTIPTVLSLRTMTRLIKWARRAQSSSKLAAFFSMVDRRKTLHRQACAGAASYPGVFLGAQVPYASIVEQMAVRRAPLGAFAARDAAARAFEEVWTELQTRWQDDAGHDEDDRWSAAQEAVASLAAQLEPIEHAEFDERVQSTAARTLRSGDSCGAAAALNGDVHFVHRFDTPSRDLERCGQSLELHEHNGRILLVSADGRQNERANTRTEVQIDRTWAVEILSGELSPVAALERRLARSAPRAIERLKAAVGEHPIVRVDSRVAGPDRAATDDAGAAVISVPSRASTHAVLVTRLQRRAAGR